MTNIQKTQNKQTKEQVSCNNCGCEHCNCGDDAFCLECEQCDCKGLVEYMFAEEEYDTAQNNKL